MAGTVLAYPPQVRLAYFNCVTPITSKICADEIGSQHTGEVRDDVAPADLASYCLHALGAADNLKSKAAVRRLITVTLAGLRPGSQ